MTEQNGEKLLSKKEAAEALNISRVTLWRHMKAGNIPFVDVLGTMYIPQTFIEQSMKQQWVLLNGEKIRTYHGKRESTKQ